MESINLSIEDYKEMRALYSKALEEGAQIFEFKEKTFTVGYAKYLLEYLTNQFQEKFYMENNHISCKQRDWAKTQLKEISFPREGLTEEELEILHQAKRAIDIVLANWNKNTSKEELNSLDDFKEVN